MNRGEYMYVVVANLLGRHKILRINRADANIILMQKQPCKATRKQAFIAHICTVSHMTQLAILHAQNKVETQNLASHKQGCAMNRGEYMYVVVATLLGRRKILRLYLADANIILM